jgi:ribulose-phosphate 3-epimerase
MIKIFPSILTNDPDELKELISQVEGVVDFASIDIIDGKFADNKTIDPQALVGFDTSLKFDFQLMVNEPVNWVEKCASAGAERIVGHIEQMSDQVEFVGKVQEVGASIGLGLDLKTPVTKLDSTILTNLDTILVMSVPAGFGGQKFDKKALEKVRELNKIRAKDDTPYKIHVDGGVTSDNISEIVKAGADEVSVGRSLFKGNIKDNIDKLLKAGYK